MKKLLYLFLAIFLISCGSDQTANISSDSSSSASSVKATADSIIAQMDNAEYAEGELLVKFKSSSRAAHRSVGATVVKSVKIVPNLEQVKLPDGVSVQDAIVQYMSNPDVEYAEPNYIRRAALTSPNDTYFKDQWGLINLGLYANGTADADIDAPEAWDISTGSDNVVIAVLDTGLDYHHSDLILNIWTNPGEPNCINNVDNDGNGYRDDCNGWDFVNNDNDPMDDNEHGTHVAGIIGAVGNNGTGITGVMWNVQLMPVKVLDSGGAGNDLDIIDGIEYAVDNGAQIINASLGGYGAFSWSLYNAIAAANTAGVLFVAAAGNGDLGGDGIGDNNDLTPFYPASYSLYLPNIISVAATDQDDIRVPFSNYGTSTVHVAAPGVYILSTIPQNLYSDMADKEFLEGTSMAAPHVSGLAGLLMSYYTTASHSQIRGMILRYVDVQPTLIDWIFTGGRINAYSAMSSLLAPTNLSIYAASSRQVSISWEDNATGEDGYIIERRTGNDPFTTVGTVGTNVESFNDNTVTPGTTYAYRISAYSSLPNPAGTPAPLTGQSSYSTEFLVATPTGSADDDDDNGGCSIGAHQNTPTAVANLAVILLPFIYIFLIRRRK
jgi:subtilisin family serine protease